MPVTIHPDNGITFPDNSVQPSSALYNRGNIVGAVSQVAGVPTGAVVESGANGDGRWMRFADGTQICYGAADFSDSGWKTGSPAITYPNSFSAIPFTILSPFDDGTGYSTAIGISSRTTTTFTIRAAAGVSDSGTTVVIHFVALGRWF